MTRLCEEARRQDGADSKLDGSAAFHGGEKKVIGWQKRFMDHRVRNEEDYLQHLEYTRLNPYGSAAFYGGGSIGK